MSARLGYAVKQASGPGWIGGYRKLEQAERAARNLANKTQRQYEVWFGATDDGGFRPSTMQSKWKPVRRDL